MGSLADPLLDAIVRAAADPDPARAFRYRPFVYDLPRAVDGFPARSRPALMARSVSRLRSTLAGLVGGVSAPARQPVPEAACAPACC